MRPVHHTEHGKLGRGGASEGAAGAFETATATGGRRGGGTSTVRFPPSFIRQDATVGQSP